MRKPKARALSLSRLASQRRVLLAVLVILFLLQCSCTSLNPKPAEFPKNPATFYKRDLEVVVDGLKYIGVGTLPLKNSYLFEVRTKHDMDRFSFTNCHRQVVEEKVDGVSMFSKTAKYKFRFERKTLIEKTDPCVLEMVASADGNEHSWAFFDFQDASFLLPAHIQCDGHEFDSHGVSVCQSKEGLVQAISFDSEVESAGDFDPPTHNNKTFIFEAPKGRNVVVFCNDERKCHRLTVLGYEQTWLRERSK